MRLLPRDRQTNSRSWLKRLGAIGFLFFLIKGLLWILIPLMVLFWGFLGF